MCWWSRLTLTMCGAWSSRRAQHKIPLFVVGGTNLLIRDGGIRGIVVSLSKLRSIKEEPGAVLYAEGGVGMPTLIRSCHPSIARRIWNGRPAFPAPSEAVS